MLGSLGESRRESTGDGVQEPASICCIVGTVPMENDVLALLNGGKHLSGNSTG